MLPDLFPSPERAGKAHAIQDRDTVLNSRKDLCGTKVTRQRRTSNRCYSLQKVNFVMTPPLRGGGKGRKASTSIEAREQLKLFKMVLK